MLLKVFQADTQLEHTFCLKCIQWILWLFVVSWYFSPLFSGAVYLEGGLEEARQLFGRLLFNGEVPNEICPAALFFLIFLVPALCLSVVLRKGCVFVWACFADRHQSLDTLHFPASICRRHKSSISTNLVPLIPSNPHTACFGKAQHIAGDRGFARLRTWDLSILASHRNTSDYLRFVCLLICTMIKQWDQETKKIGM